MSTIQLDALPLADLVAFLEANPPSLPYASLSGVPKAATQSMVAICDQLLAASQAQFDTNTILGGNIPQTYRHLKLILSGIRLDGSGAAGAYLKFNNDAAAADYASTVRVYGTGSSPTGDSIAASTSGAYVAETAISTDLASEGVQAEILVADYTSTTFHKAVESRSWNLPESRVMMLAAGWKSTAAVTRLTLTPASGNFVAGGRFTLYGLN